MLGRYRRWASCRVGVPDARCGASPCPGPEVQARTGRQQGEQCVSDLAGAGAEVGHRRFGDVGQGRGQETYRGLGPAQPVPVTVGAYRLEKAHRVSGRWVRSARTGVEGEVPQRGRVLGTWGAR